MLKQYEDQTALSTELAEASATGRKFVNGMLDEMHILVDDLYQEVDEKYNEANEL